MILSDVREVDFCGSGIGSNQSSIPILGVSTDCVRDRGGGGNERTFGKEIQMNLMFIKRINSPVFCSGSSCALARFPHTLHMIFSLFFLMTDRRSASRI